MSTTLSVLAELRGIHNCLQALVERLDEDSLRRQYHPELSPIGWHYAHCAHVEKRWLLGEILGRWKGLGRDGARYLPERAFKPERGRRLPPRERLLRQVRADQEQTLLLLSGMADRRLPEHPLLENDYLPLFFLQHHQQHYETMLLVLAQRAQARHRHQFFPERRLRPAGPETEFVALPACSYPVGGERPEAFDNELPAWSPELEEFEIARRPVTNAQWLAFMEAGGYENPSLWSEDGRAWLQLSGARHPEHWRQDARGWWYGILAEGPYELHPDFPVHGINLYEAEAYARWAGGRLPHEHEWEAAHRLHALQLVGVVWEWCGNAFFPYPGYEPFPYTRYSQAWFDGRHHTLRGGSLYTRPRIKRASFRNFYLPDKRHVLAGLRLARDGSGRANRPAGSGQPALQLVHTTAESA
ncbi:MAG: ergothioneine biosynthesis protein EgtB [Gammaproteobacteria bacterium]|nr:MAG: ergothioneine biosynthesis protein EgtB [Gammaproteobacteria bacterium]